MDDIFAALLVANSVDNVNKTLIDKSTQDDLNNRKNAIQQSKNKLTDIDIKIAEYKIQGLAVSPLEELFNREVKNHNQLVTEYNNIINSLEKARQERKAKWEAQNQRANRRMLIICGVIGSLVAAVVIIAIVCTIIK